MRQDLYSLMKMAVDHIRNMHIMKRERRLKELSMVKYTTG